MPVPRERPRFFTMQQKLDHAEGIGGWHSELEADKFQPSDYGGSLEGHHMQPYGQGGETEDENLLLLSKVDHAIVHLISDEPWSAQLIEKRMTPEELEELHKRGY